MTRTVAATEQTAREMLILSFLSYRAYGDLRAGHLELGHLRAAVRGGLAEVTPVRDWELVWGPAAYRAPFTVFDENVMYVVRHRTAPHRFAVTIRGTNPVSAFDWLFGDLWTGVMTPWTFGADDDAPGAAVSLSTMLGINVLRHLRSAGPRRGPLAGLWRFVDETMGESIRGGVRRTLRPFGPVIAAGLDRLRLELRSDLRRLRGRLEGSAGLEAGARVEALLARRFSEPALRLRRRLDEAAGMVGPEAHRELLRLLEGSFRLRTRLAPGSTVFEFLRGAGREAGVPLDVTVTGHSKGGALAPTFALALAQSRGRRGVPEARRWDPDGAATVSCYSYAGPTAGNAAFAGLSDRVIGDRCHRIANRLDVVPHAWAVRSHPDEAGFFIENVPDLYGDGVHRIPGLTRLAAAVAADVGPLGYRHVGRHVTTLPGVVDPNRRLFVDQMVYQHGAAYLDLLGVDEDPLLFFSPLR